MRVVEECCDAHRGQGFVEAPSLEEIVHYDQVGAWGGGWGRLCVCVWADAGWVRGMGHVAVPPYPLWGWQLPAALVPAGQCPARHSRAVQAPSARACTKGSADSCMRGRHAPSVAPSERAGKRVAAAPPRSVPSCSGRGATWRSASARAWQWPHELLAQSGRRFPLHARFAQTAGTGSGPAIPASHLPGCTYTDRSCSLPPALPNLLLPSVLLSHSSFHPLIHPLHGQAGAGSLAQ